MQLRGPAATIRNSYEEFAVSDSLNKSKNCREGEGRRKWGARLQRTGAAADKIAGIRRYLIFPTILLSQNNS